VTVFSIITVVYNGAELLPGTMQSVFEQDYVGGVEYIVVDGASKDRSVELIRAYAAKMPYLRWVSERDKGLYDAMNKGLAMATGDFVLFLNAGDALADPTVLRRLAAMVGPQTDVLYGETMLVDDARVPQGTMSALSTRRLPERLHWRDYLQGMLVVHQSFLPRRTLAGPYLLDNLCADYDWCIRILKQSRENVNAGFVVSNYLMGGISKKRHRKSLIDRFEVMQAHFGLFQAVLAHAYIVGRAVWHRVTRLGKKKY
jgi:glycosyltransferase involved in cell wall biosynthesis